MMAESFYTNCANRPKLRKIDDVPQIERKEVNKDELKLSISLVETMSSSLNEIDLTDRYKDALKELIEAKIAGREVVVRGRREAGGGYHDRAQAEHRGDQGEEEADGTRQRRKKAAEKAPVEVVVEPAPALKQKKRKAA